MKRFEKMELADALKHAESGGQALHVWVPQAGERMRSGIPACFKRSLAWAHLFDLDTPRLMRTARELGVERFYIHYKGTKRQHVDLCGMPLKLATVRCEE